MNDIEQGVLAAVAAEGRAYRNLETTKRDFNRWVPASEGEGVTQAQMYLATTRHHLAAEDLRLWTNTYLAELDARASRQRNHDHHWQTFVQYDTTAGGTIMDSTFKQKCECGAISDMRIKGDDK